MLSIVELFPLILIMFLSVIGLHNILKPGMLLGKLGLILDRVFCNKWEQLGKPVYSCAPCMQSLWGSLLFICFSGIHYAQLYWYFSWIVSVVAASGLSSIYVQLTRRRYRVELPCFIDKKNPEDHKDNIESREAQTTIFIDMITDVYPAPPDADIHIDGVDLPMTQTVVRTVSGSTLIGMPYEELLEVLYEAEH